MQSSTGSIYPSIDVRIILKLSYEGQFKNASIAVCQASEEKSLGDIRHINRTLKPYPLHRERIGIDFTFRFYKLRLFFAISCMGLFERFKE